MPKKPTRGAIENEISVTVGSEDTARLGFGSGGALTPELAYRLDVSNYSGGWVDRGRNSDATFSGALLWQPRADLQLMLTHAQGYQKPMRYFGTPLVEGQLEAAPPQLQRGRQRDPLPRPLDPARRAVTPNADVEWRTRVYQIDSQRDWRNAEAYVYNRATGLIDRSGNTEITHNQDQTGLTSTLRVRGTAGGLQNNFAVGLDANRAHFKHTNNTYPLGPGRSVRSGAGAVRQRNAAALPQPCRAVRAVRGRPAGAERALVGAGWPAPRPRAH